MQTDEFPSSKASSSKLRILVVAPSLGILGGQAVQAARLVEQLRQEETLDVSFLPVNPVLPGGFKKLQAIKYVRTILKIGRAHV